MVFSYALAIDLSGVLISMNNFRAVSKLYFILVANVCSSSNNYFFFFSLVLGGEKLPPSWKFPSSHLREERTYKSTTTIFPLSIQVSQLSNYYWKVFHRFPFVSSMASIDYVIFVLLWKKESPWMYFIHYRQHFVLVWSWSSFNYSSAYLLTFRLVSVSYVKSTAVKESFFDSVASSLRKLSLLSDIAVPLPFEKLSALENLSIDAVCEGDFEKLTKLHNVRALDIQYAAETGEEYMGVLLSIARLTTLESLRIPLVSCSGLAYLTTRTNLRYLELPNHAAKFRRDSELVFLKPFRLLTAL